MRVTQTLYFSTKQCENITFYSKSDVRFEWVIIYEFWMLKNIKKLQKLKKFNKSFFIKIFMLL